MDQWTEYELGELLEYEQPTKYIVESTNYSDDYSIPVLTAGKSFILGYTNEEDGVFDDDLPVIIFDDFTTASKYVNFKFKVKSSAMKILHINTDLVLPRYIYYRLQVIQLDSSTHKRYWIQQYSKLKISIPPILEQERIVSRIEEMFSEIDNAEENLQATKLQLEVYRQAVLKEAFSDIKEKRSIKELAVLVTSGSRGWAKYYSDDGAMFIRIGNLTRDRISIDLHDVQYVNLPDKCEGTRTKLQANDVLVSITADLGSIGFVPINIEDAYINQHIALIRFLSAEQGEFMAWYLKSEYGQKDLLKNRRGGGKLGLGLDDIRNTRVPVVTNTFAKEVVDKIHEKMSICDNFEQTVELTLQQVEALRQSILKKHLREDLNNVQRNICNNF